jgi:polar amino acid transport system permease protein
MSDDHSTQRGSDAPSLGASARPVPIRAIPVRHPWRWVGSAVIIVLGAMLFHTLVFSQTQQPHQTGSRYGWSTIRQYLFGPTVIHGVVVTIELTVIAMAVGILIGILLAVMRLSQSRLISGVAWIYVWFFRGTPVLVQLFFWYFIQALYPHITIGIPFGPAFVTLNANAFLTPFVAASLALSFNEGAYMAEIVRAGIISVDEGQSEAAQSIGMSRSATLRLIVLPQAMRLILPPTGNETISMLKTSSLAWAITVPELFFATNQIASTTYRTIPLLIVASIWYLFMTTLLSIGQYYLERHYAKGSSRALPDTPLQSLRRNLFRLRTKPAPEVAPAMADIGRPHD